MKPNIPIYITAASQISIQEPLCDKWMSEPLLGLSGYNEAIDPVFKEWMSPGEARRLGKIMKRAVVTSAECMKASGITMPDAIITATGLGCVKNTELFLTDLCTQGESLLKPTQFMQSTHNTISSLIAILNKCHGYNVTYAQGDMSADVALLDAVTQLSLGDIKTALVGAHDEMTPNYYTLLNRSEYYGHESMVSSGEVAVSFMLSSNADREALCSIDDIAVFYKPATESLRAYLATIGNVDCILAGYNGIQENDMLYDNIISLRDNPDTPVLQYKNLFGESMTASALGLYAAVRIISTGNFHNSMYRSGSIPADTNSVLIINASGNDVSLMKLSKVSL
ncbi:MAG: beta-ketoacyl synthase chain length factor [Muribaculaceae bacterium]|nr:beta-ketoacyl synthase chain length factor [Muribaculaceae bacterium]